LAPKLAKWISRNGKLRPILFYLRKLTPAEENYTTYDKEMLAIVQVMKKFHITLDERKTR